MHQCGSERDNQVSGHTCALCAVLTPPGLLLTGLYSDPSRPELAKLGTSFGNRVRLWDPRNELDRCAKQIFSWLTASLSPFVGRGSHQKIAPGRQRQTALGSPDA